MRITPFLRSRSNTCRALALVAALGWAASPAAAAPVDGARSARRLREVHLAVVVVVRDVDLLEHGSALGERGGAEGHEHDEDTGEVCAHWPS